MDISKATGKPSGKGLDCMLYRAVEQRLNSRRLKEIRVEQQKRKTHTEKGLYGSGKNGQ